MMSPSRSEPRNADRQDGDECPRIQLGWVAMDTERRADAGSAVADQLRDRLAAQLPEFDWRLERVERPLGRRYAPVDPLELLERGVQEKIGHHWDFALVVTGAELVARERPFIYGVPSSALETAVVSRSRLAGEEDPERRMLVLTQFLFGSLLGLEAREEGAMRRPRAGRTDDCEPFSPIELEQLRSRLRDVGDARLEEQGRRWNRWTFRWRTLSADPRGILRDIVGYRPWRQPFRLGKLTAAAFVSMLLLFLGAEAWELGEASGPAQLASGALLSVGITAWFLYRGQNLSDLTRGVGLSEQVVRSRIVLWWCLLLGVASLWLFLFLSSFALASVLPRGEIESWLGSELDAAARLRFAAFLSSLGTLAGGLGGNLEDENHFKARFFFDEEV